MGFSESSVFLKVCLVVLPIALLLQIIGVATKFWVSIDEAGISSSVGLWKACLQSVCASFNSATTLPDWWNATRAFGIIGILAMAASVVITILCIFVFTRGGQKLVFMINMVVTFAAGASILVAIIIFGVKYKADDSFIALYDIGWSFGLSVAAGVLAIIGGVLLIIDSSQSSS